MQTVQPVLSSMSEYGFMEFKVVGPQGGSIKAIYFGGQDRMLIVTDNGVGLGGSMNLNTTDEIAQFAQSLGNYVYLSEQNVQQMRGFLLYCEERAVIEDAFQAARKQIAPRASSELGTDYASALTAKYKKEYGGPLSDEFEFVGEKGTLEIEGLTDVQVFRPRGQEGFVLIGTIADDLDAQIGKIDYEFRGEKKTALIKQIALLCADSMSYSVSPFYIYDYESAVKVMQFSLQQCYDSGRYHREGVRGDKNTVIAAEVLDRASRGL